MTANYVGPDAHPLRTILAPFADDDDVFDPDVTPTNTITIPGKRSGSGAPISRVMLTFVFYLANGLRAAGGTANLRPFFVESSTAYGRTAAPGVVHPSSDTLVDYSLSDPLIVTVTKHPEFGLKVTNIAAPFGATELRIALQEFT